MSSSRSSPFIRCTGSGTGRSPTYCRSSRGPRWWCVPRGTNRPTSRTFRQDFRGRIIPWSGSVRFADNPAAPSPASFRFSNYGDWVFGYTAGEDVRGLYFNLTTRVEDGPPRRLPTRAGRGGPGLRSPHRRLRPTSPTRRSRVGPPVALRQLAESAAGPSLRARGRCGCHGSRLPSDRQVSLVRSSTRTRRPAGMGRDRRSLLEPGVGHGGAHRFRHAATTPRRSAAKRRGSSSVQHLDRIHAIRSGSAPGSQRPPGTQSLRLIRRGTREQPTDEPDHLRGPWTRARSTGCCSRKSRDGARSRKCLRSLSRPLQDAAPRTAPCRSIPPATRRSGPPSTCRSARLARPGSLPRSAPPHGAA